MISDGFPAVVRHQIQPYGEAYHFAMTSSEKNEPVNI